MSPVLHIKITWIDEAEVIYPAIERKYENGVLFIFTENFPDIGDRRSFEVPLANVRLVEVSR